MGNDIWNYFIRCVERYKRWVDLFKKVGQLRRRVASVMRGCLVRSKVTTDRFFMITVGGMSRLRV